MNSNLLYILDLARELYGSPIVLSSAIRCKKHNKDVGGSSTSSHLTGDAVDIKIRNSRERYNILFFLVLADLVRIGALTRTQAEWVVKVSNKESVLTRFGIGDNFIHADVDNLKDSKVLWTYPNKEIKNPIVEVTKPKLPWEWVL
jgi:hypothetical protein